MGTFGRYSSRPGVASIIWEGLVSIGGRSRENFEQPFCTSLYIPM